LHRRKQLLFKKNDISKKGRIFAPVRYAVKA
jgi:hypothetical protein